MKERGRNRREGEGEKEERRRMKGRKEGREGRRKEEKRRENKGKTASDHPSLETEHSGGLSENGVPCFHDDEEWWR